MNEIRAIIVVLEKNKVIELLPDSEAKTLSRWLEQYPSVKIVSRDRSSLKNNRFLVGDVPTIVRCCKNKEVFSPLFL